MTETYVVSALKAKRAELSGELAHAEKRIPELRTTIAALDGALKVFDPKALPSTIRPVLKRKPQAIFRHGALGRLIRDV